MSNWIFPTESCRVVDTRGAAQSPVLSAAGQTVTIYTDIAGTTLANIFDYPSNSAITGSQLTLDSYSRIPYFHGPDTATNTLYGKVGSGPVFPINARCLGGEDPNNHDGTVAGSGTYVAPSVVCHAATGTAATDDANVRQAIGDTPRGGWLHLPNAGNTHYAIQTTPVSITEAIKVSGGGVFPLYGSLYNSSDSIDVPAVSPYLSGSVLKQVTAGQDVLSIPVAGLPVHLENLGLTWATAAQWVNTGHGINAVPPAHDSWLDNGVMGPQWRNLAVFGHDGNHYAYRIVNSLYGQFDHLQSFGGGLILFEVNGDTWQFYGGATFIEPYGQLICAGSAHGIHLKSTASTPNNFHFIRPQVSVQGKTGLFPASTAPTSAQKQFKADAAVKWYKIDQPDFETNVGSVPDFGGTYRSVDPAGIIAGNPDFPVMEAQMTNVKRTIGANLNLVPSDRRLLNSGDISVTSTSYVQASATLSDITLPASVGDILEISMSSRWFGHTNSCTGILDVASIVSGSIVNYFSGTGSTGYGFTAWASPAITLPIGVPVQAAVQAGDLSNGTVTVRLITRIDVAASVAKLKGNSSEPFLWAVKNLGQPS